MSHFDKHHISVCVIHCAKLVIQVVIVVYDVRTLVRHAVIHPQLLGRFYQSVLLLVRNLVL